jgi:hypothetical protein
MAGQSFASTAYPRRLRHEVVEVELRHVAGCPHTDAARALLRECLTELRLHAAVADKEGEYPSPTILVNGEDVMGAPSSQAAACRLDVPTRQRLLAALRGTQPSS